MAMGSGMKRHLNVYNNGSRGGRSYGLMLLLAFGIAIFGVMVIFKLRERRIFNLMVKEKDHQLISLQLLLQKEREYGKEAKSRLEEMKAKLRTLRIQKTERDSRILEMQSTISSLKDEQRTIELALEEKQNEIKQLRDNYADANDEHNQAQDISEILRQKEAEIEDLKHRLEIPVKVWSVSADDPANSMVNSTVKASTASRDETMVNQSKEERARFRELINSQLGKNSTQEADISSNESANNMNGKGEIGQVIAEQSEMTGEEQSKNEVQKRGDEEHGGHATSHNELETTANDQTRNEMQMNYKGGMKSEMPENLHGAEDSMLRGRGKMRYVRKIRGKRRRITAKSREITENSSVGLAGKRDTGFFRSTYESERDRRARDEKPESFDQNQDLGMDSSKRNESEKLPDGEGLKLKIDKQVGLQHGKGKENSGENSSGNNRNTIEDSPPSTMSMREKLEDAEDTKQEAANNITLNSENKRTSTEAREQNSNDTEQPEKRDTIQPNVHRSDVDKADNSGVTKIHDKDNDLDDPEKEDAQETETETDTSRVSKSNLKENGEEYQEKKK